MDDESLIVVGTCPRCQGAVYGRTENGHPRATPALMVHSCAVPARPEPPTAPPTPPDPED